MKIKLTSILYLLPILFFVNCNKKDKSLPTITLNGDAEKIISLNSSYVEDGAIATDKKGDDISKDIVTSGEVDVNKVGEYQIYYNVEDKKGRKAKEVQRNLYVLNEADGMSGLYLATPNVVGTSGTSSYSSYTFGTSSTTSYYTTVSASETINNQITIDNGVRPYNATVSNSNMNVPFQTDGISSIQGAGNITGANFLLNLNLDDVVCDVNHVKQ